MLSRFNAALTGKSDILHSYIVPEYDILHTQSKDYIVDDILQVMRERGMTLGMTANPILLQKKYARVVEAFAEKAGLTLGRRAGLLLSLRNLPPHQRGRV